MYDRGGWWWIWLILSCALTWLAIAAILWTDTPPPSELHKPRNTPMTFTQAKIDAYSQLDAAIENIRNVYKAEDPNDDDKDILTGWVVLTTSVEFIGTEPDHDDDPLDTRTVSGWYSKRGQHPVLSYGIVQEGVRHYDKINTVTGDE